VIQSSKDKVHFSTYKQERKALPDYKSESLVSFFNRLKLLINVFSKRRHDILLKLVNKEETNVI
jgi:hypothetical protein